jgi:hypothetical protein
LVRSKKKKKNNNNKMNRKNKKEKNAMNEMNKKFVVRTSSAPSYCQRSFSSQRDSGACSCLSFEASPPLKPTLVRYLTLSRPPNMRASFLRAHATPNVRACGHGGPTQRACSEKGVRFA